VGCSVTRGGIAASFAGGGTRTKLGVAASLPLVQRG